MNGQPPTRRYRWQAGEGDDHPDCFALDGVTRPLEAWQNSRMPGFHPGCRAVLHPLESADAFPVRLQPPAYQPPLRMLHYRLQNGRIVPAWRAVPASAALPHDHHRAGRN